MAKYPKDSHFTKEIWNKMMSAFRAAKLSGITELEFPIDCVINGEPVGKYLEVLRQYRCEGELTKDELRICSKMGIKLQWLDVNRHWMYMYNRAKAYYEREGHCEVKVEEDSVLCYWIYDQKKRYRGAPRKRMNRVDIYSPLSSEQQRLLEEIEIVWTPAHKWKNYYELLVDFNNEFHHTSVPSGTIIGRYYLGNWVAKIRRHKEELSEEQLKQLDDINFNWKSLKDSGTSFWEQATYWYFGTMYPDVKNRIMVEGKELDIYSEEKRVAIEYDGSHWHKNKINDDNEKDRICSDNKIKMIRIREYGLPHTCCAKNYFLPKAFRAHDFDILLKDIFEKEFGFIIDVDTRRDGLKILKNYRRLEDLSFYKHLEELKEYLNIHHHFPSTNKPRSPLSNWIFNLRQIRRGLTHGVLSEEQIRQLDEIGFVWNPYEKKINDIYTHLKFYVEQGHENLPSDYVDPVDGFTLGSKVRHLRQRGPLGKSYGGKKLSDEWTKKFSALRVNWNHGEPLIKPRAHIVELEFLY